MAARWKKRLKQLWARRPHLGRGARTAINLVVIAVILLYSWGLAGYPLFFPALEFKRLVRTNLAPEGETVFSVTPVVINGRYYGGRTKPRDGSTGVQLTHAWRVSATENWVVAGNLDLDWLGVYPRGEGADPVPLSLETVMATYPDLHMCELLLILDMPVGTSPFLPDGPGRAEVEIGPFEYEGRTNHLSGKGTDLGDGVWLFALNSENVIARGLDWYAGAPYVLRAYSGLDGGLILEQEGTIPKGVP